MAQVYVATQITSKEELAWKTDVFCMQDLRTVTTFAETPLKERDAFHFPNKASVVTEHSETREVSVEDPLICQQLPRAPHHPTKTNPP